MLLDRLDLPASSLFLSHPVFQRSLEWLRNFDPAQPNGIYEIEGKNLYVNVHGYDTKPQAACRWESHRHTMDIQYCLSGGEIIRCEVLYDQEPNQPYTEKSDAFKWDDAGEAAQSVRLAAGRFVIFSPGEAHAPGGADGVNTAIRKAVVKISAGVLGAK